jgi:hypothetical protein
MNRHGSTLWDPRRKPLDHWTVQFRGYAIAGSVKQGSEVKIRGLHNQKKKKKKKDEDVNGWKKIEEIGENYVSLCVLLCSTLAIFANLPRCPSGFGMRSISWRRLGASFIWRGIAGRVTDTCLPGFNTQGFIKKYLVYEISFTGEEWSADLLRGE